MGKWLLPENLADILPAEARRIEELRRTLLDLYRSYGYELVMPPLVEYLESLLSGTGSDLNLRTFKLVDQLSGRTLGVRADITTQVTRIDAHLLNRSGVTRLCYCGSVLHARAAGFGSTREPLQIGAEIYGHPGAEADIEVMQLALATVACAGLTGVRLDLAHPGLVRALLELDPAAASLSDDVFELLRTKDVPALRQLAEGFAPEVRAALCALPSLYGDTRVLSEARALLPQHPGIAAALDELDTLVRALPVGSVSIDLADVRGLHYHTGITFAVYADGWADVLVRGGRYDDVGRAFGRARPATGFTLDLRVLAGLLLPAAPGRAVRAPWGADAALLQTVAALRAAGHIVVQTLPGHEPDQQEYVCDRELVAREGHWHVVPLAPN